MFSGRNPRRSDTEIGGHILEKSKISHYAKKLEFFFLTNEREVFETFIYLEGLFFFFFTNLKLKLIDKVGYMLLKGQ